MEIPYSKTESGYVLPISQDEKYLIRVEEVLYKFLPESYFEEDAIDDHNGDDHNSSGAGLCESKKRKGSLVEGIGRSMAEISKIHKVDPDVQKFKQSSSDQPIAALDNDKQQDQEQDQQQNQEAPATGT